MTESDFPEPPPQERPSHVDVSQDSSRKVILRPEVDGKGGERPEYEGEADIVVDGEEKTIVMGEWIEELEWALGRLARGARATIELEDREVVLEVRDFRNPPPVYKLEPDEKVAAAESRRMAGNAYYKDGEFKKAEKKYKAALTYLDDKFGIGVIEKTLLLKNTTALRNNLAALYLQTKQYYNAVEQLTELLRDFPENQRARLRRAKAYNGCFEWAKAEADLAQVTDPELEEEAGTLRRTITAAQQKHKKSDQAMYRKMF